VSVDDAGDLRFRIDAFGLDDERCSIENARFDIAWRDRPMRPERLNESKTRCRSVASEASKFH
jgi:hypothetical protein